MAITLDGNELPELKWLERFQSFGVQGAVEMTRGGKPWVWEGDISGRHVTLRGGSDYGIMLYSLYKTIRGLAETKNARYILEWGDGSTNTIRFRQENPPAVSGEPVLTDYADEPADDVYMRNIEIRMAIVE